MGGAEEQNAEVKNADVKDVELKDEKREGVTVLNPRYELAVATGVYIIAIHQGQSPESYLYLKFVTVFSLGL